MSRLLSISTTPVPLVTNTKLALEAVDSILLSLIVIPSTAKDPVNTAEAPSNVKLEDGELISFPEQIKLTLYGTNAIINFNLLELGSCFSLKFYDENVWVNLNPCYFDDYAGKTSGIRKFSSKSFDEVFTFINESVESGKIFTVK